MVWVDKQDQNNKWNHTLGFFQPLSHRKWSFKPSLGNVQTKLITRLWALRMPHQCGFYEDIPFEFYTIEREDSSHWIKEFQLHLLLATKYTTSIKNSQGPLHSRSIALDYYTRTFLREAAPGFVDVAEYSTLPIEWVGREWWSWWYQWSSATIKGEFTPSRAP